MMISAALAEAIGVTVGASLRAAPASSVHGGSINECYRWESSAGPLFVKVTTARGSAMFAAEAAGLEELRSAKAVRVPRVLGLGQNETHAWLVLEWIPFDHSSAVAQARLGEQLALQHRRTAPAFGWARDNTIGSTPQVNTRTTDWVEFFREHRLRYQLDLAARGGHGGNRLCTGGERLLNELGAFFSDYRPVPSLVHGDLWDGNWAADAADQPVIFDPAVYYADREVDLAMTRLFGGFGADFYAAYAATWPLDPGARVRVDLYNLYHVLNHLNLFGGGYLGQALTSIDRLVAAIS
jgi:protein-ribulosamine 3-kinase